LAGMGFVAVFGGAANTPIAATLMGIELFGVESGVYMAIACVMSYLCSGHGGIYRAQRIDSRKFPAEGGLR
jgi:H+/Cl- antiporter ClcA